MGAASSSVRTFRGWDCLAVTRGPLELFLVPKVGGRLMGVRYRDRELLFVHPELAGRCEETGSVVDVAQRKRELGFLLWGGDKTWLSPQSRWPEDLPLYDLDNGPWASSVDGAEVTLQSPVCRESGVRLVRHVRVEPEGHGFRIRHVMENRSDAAMEWGLWSVTMLLRPGVVRMPLRSESRYPEGVKSYDEGDSAALRDRVLRIDDGSALVACLEGDRFKYGADPEPAWIEAWLGDPGQSEPGVLYTKRVTTPARGRYGHGCSVEVFNSHEHPYFEIEVHGDVCRLLPGERQEMVERVTVGLAEPF